MTQTSIILCTLGTRGDIVPFLALCRELVARGHHTTLLTNENWRDAVLATGAAFYAIAPQDPPQSGRDDNRFFVESTVPSFRKSFDHVSQHVQTDPDCVLVYRANMLGMESAAEKYGLPHVKIALQPSAVKSLKRPPWPLNRLVEGRNGPFAKRVLVPALYLMVEMLRGHYRHRNGFRRSVGLPPHALGHMGARTETLSLVFAPKWFARPPEDWPDNCHCTGFLFDGAGAPAPDIDAFITQHGAPLVFTPGTGVSDVARFFRKAVQICEAAGVPGLFLSGQPVTIGEAKVPVLKKDFADLAGVLPSARLIVHHGGIGTTAQALRAGIPQIILPDRFDQSDNAVRIATLGLGAAIMQDNQPVEAWAGLVRRLTHDILMQQRLKKVSAAIAAEPSVTRACDHIERAAGLPRRRQVLP